MKKGNNKNFLWGVATSSYQIEGSPDKDGKGISVWDTFTHLPGNIKNGDHGDVACDHYNLWKDDVKLLNELGVDAYRFSISWPRILPSGLNSKPNISGIDFYSRLVDELLEIQIDPFVTLNHWDLPQGLEDIGGWPDRAVAEAFVDYADVVTRHLGDRVKNWITHNEPWCISNNGYLSGSFPPGLVNDGSKYFATIHHLLLSHGMSIPAIKENSKNCQVGITLNLCPAYPASSSESDKAASHEFDGKFNRLFLDPLYKGEYPSDIIDGFIETGLISENDLQFIHGDDMDTIRTKTDFLGINYYSRGIIRDNNIPNEKNLPVEIIKGEETEMKWEIYPAGLYDLLKRVNDEYAVNSIYITESGCSFSTGPDKNGIIDDNNRIEYHKEYISELKRAVQDGVPCEGYFAWSLMDNFEWNDGYSQRFGLVWVDYDSQNRLPKNSYWWYKEFIKNEHGSKI